MYDSFWLHLSLVLTAVATLFYLPALSKEGIRSVALRLGQGCLVVATLALTYAAFGRYDSQVWTDAAPLLLSVFVLWIALFATFVLKTKMIGLFASPLVTLLLFIHAFFFPATQTYLTIDDPTAQYLAGFHVLFAVIGEALFAAAAGLAALYLWQHRALRRKQISKAIYQGLPLDKLESWLIKSLWCGFAFLTIGLVLGAIYTQAYLQVRPEGLTAKIAWALATWGWYLGTLNARYNLNRLPSAIARMALWGFVLLAVSMFGLGFFRISGVGPA
jgi:ABC-type uncharacterized transport system permease subunit